MTLETQQSPVSHNEVSIATAPRPTPRVLSERQLAFRLLPDDLPLVITIGYVAVLTTAELLTTYIDAQLGLLAHAILLTFVLIMTARWWDHPLHRLFICLVFGPLIRIISLSLPLAAFEFMYWLLITSIPLFVTAFMGIRLIRLSGNDVGYNLGRGRFGVLTEVAIGLTGLPLGYMEYVILRPEPLISTLSWEYLWLPALIILISTGLMEELVFRGMMQHTAKEALGSIGILIVALVFAILHIGYKSVPDLVFVFTVGLFYGWVVNRTGSILGVTISHGLINTMLFIVFPVLAQLGLVI